MGLKHLMAGAALAALQASSLAMAQDGKADVPPSADLTYTVQALQKGFSLAGESVVNWRVADGRYSLVANTRAMLLGQIIENRSEGAIVATGLAPDQFYEKRMRKSPFTTTFDREANTVAFSEDKKKRYQIRGGEQDRASAQWQLASMARATPGKFAPGAEVSFVVAGRTDAKMWRFKVAGKETLATGAGTLETVHLAKSNPEPGEQAIDLWFAPSLGWYPVKLRFSDKDGEYVEQTLAKLTKK
ncbi:DUF3108 domain-containing protein [Pseudoduganella sp. GCM10020061]|uniref:DUF3108 domain-containing protein n=1 Tax=Pseudoduganella sp. GCM10020061 TaxID=3317345 RepID=UPI00363432FB